MQTSEVIDSVLQALVFLNKNSEIEVEDIKAALGLQTEALRIVVRHMERKLK